MVLNGVQHSLTSQTVEPTGIAEEVGRVQCRIAGTVTDPSFDPRDGDAAHLPPGTPLHAVSGQPVQAAVAVEQDGSWHLYTADEGTSP
ncbi:hypothetical protein [Kineococcus sp. G2]|uniref:hypothetical protein n=1 Tax=Kineococcus sp. G2 TaxID=3127484 RepID=UPI00301CF619